MSTLPGPDSWRDAGLDPPADADVGTTHDPDDYVPDAPRPDNDGDADEADVVQQALDALADEDDDESPGPG
ncbi:hypothetical protein [Promicromonospora sukumoe]